MDKFSDKYTYNEPELYPQLASMISVLVNWGGNQVSVTELDNGKLGLCFKIEVDTGSASLLKHKEPVVLSVDKDDPLKTVPIVYPDRLDFPFEKYPHVNYPHDNMPPSLCLSREDAEEWYSEISFHQFMDVLKQWLDDAANDRLIKLSAQDEYEPYRVPDNAKWIFFRNNDIDEYIERGLVDCALYLDARLHDKLEIGFAEYAVARYDQDAIYLNLSQSCDHVDKDWYVGTPSKIAEILDLIKRKGYQFDLEDLKSNIKIHTNIKRIFLGLSVHRPTKLIGKRTKVDTLCFTFESEPLLNGNYDAKADAVIIYEMITSKYAEWISKTSPMLSDKKILVLGVGAVGSVLVDLLYRSGITQMTICDNDSFNAHNVCRHVLSKGLALKQKVDLIKDHLAKMFQDASAVAVEDKDAVEYLRTIEPDAFDIIIDATASSRVMYAIDEIQPLATIVRVCLSNNGKVGMTYIRKEGDARLQEYYYQILREGLKEDDTAADISHWIKSDKNTTLDRVRIGEGCHSNTMRMGYNKVMPHASLAVSVIKNLHKGGAYNLHLSFADYDYEGSMYTERFTVPQYLDIQSDQDSWHIRIPADLLESIKTEVMRRGSKEAGGYLMGLIDEKRGTIFVLTTHIPDNSKGSPSSLVLGDKGWKEYRNAVEDKTAGQLRYLGDWHSHPHGSTDRSATDIETFRRLRPEIRGGVCIITNGYKHKGYVIGL